MKRYSQKTSLVTLSDINITPLLDLAFVLLIIFMITTPLMEHGIPLQLPKSSTNSGKLDRDDLFLAEINADGAYYMDSQPVTLENLETELRKAYTENPEMVLVIRADETADWGAVHALIDRAKNIGNMNLSFQHQLQ